VNTHDRPSAKAEARQAIEKISIVVSKGSRQGIYPGLNMAKGARDEGIETNLFFTYFGLDAVNRHKHGRVKVAAVANAAPHLATLARSVPGVPGFVTHRITGAKAKLDTPPVPAFIETLADAGATLYVCQASLDLLGLTLDDLVPQVREIITVGDFYNLAAGGQIIYT
jgi:peroxiredoxin family protein